MPRTAIISSPDRVSLRVQFCRGGGGGLRFSREQRLSLVYLAPEGVEVYPISIRVIGAAAAIPEVATQLAGELDCSARVGTASVTFSCRGFPGFSIRIVYNRAGRWAAPVGTVAAAELEEKLPGLPVLELLSRETADQLSDATMRLHSSIGRVVGRTYWVRVRGVWTVERFVVREPEEVTLPVPAYSPYAKLEPGLQGDVNIWETAPEGAAPLKVVTGVMTGVGVPARARIALDPWLLARIYGGKYITLTRLLSLVEDSPETVLERLLMSGTPPIEVEVSCPGLHIHARRLTPSPGRVYTVTAGGDVGYVEVPGPAALVVHRATRQGARAAERLQKLLMEIIEAG